MPATSVWLARTEAAMNRTIAVSTAAATAAARLNGTSIEIDVDGIARVSAAVFNGSLMMASLDRGGPSGVRPDAVISGSLLSLLRASSNAAAPQARPGLRVSGDAEIAAAYRTLFRLATPDFEEQAARFIGDTPARALRNFAANSLQYLQRLRHTVGSNIAEYLQEESRDLVSRTEVDEFLHGVDEVRETADRVAAPLARVEQRLQGGA